MENYIHFSEENNRKNFERINDYYNFGNDNLCFVLSFYNFINLNFERCGKHESNVFTMRKENKSKNKSYCITLKVITENYTNFNHIKLKKKSKIIFKLKKKEKTNLNNEPFDVTNAKNHIINYNDENGNLTLMSLYFDMIKECIF